ncbi:MAG: hypothetical protein ACR2PT_11745 [Endozoicomonas sp.]
MKSYLQLPVIAGILLCVSACSHIPNATTVAQEKQVKLQSAQHWGVIASHLSDQILDSSGLKNSTLFIDERNNQTSFSKVFSKQLTSQLVNNDVEIIVSPTAKSLELIVDVDVIKHPKDRDTGIKIPLTAGLANIWLISEAGTFGAIPTVVAADYLNSLPNETNTEIAVTTRILEGPKIRFSQTNIYYVTDNSSFQYSSKKGDRGNSIGLTDKEVPGVF